MDPSERFFRSLYEKQYEKMFKLAYRMTGSIEKTQDLVQNAFLLALFRKEELMVHPKPEGWLMTALKNLIFNERRRSESHPEVPLESVIESLSVNDPGDAFGTWPLPQARLSKERPRDPDPAV